MTGWRLGWAIGPPELISAMTSYQSHTTSNASSISQAAALEALTGLEDSSASVAEMLSHYEARRTAMVEGLAAIPGVRCPMPEGAFYAFADVSALYARKGVPGSAGFCDRLLAEAHVATVPGDAFGSGSLRPLLLRHAHRPHPRGRPSDRGLGRALARPSRSQNRAGEAAGRNDGRDARSGARAPGARWSRNSRYEPQAATRTAERT